MMRWIVGSSLNLRLLVVVLAAAMMVFGVAQLRAAPVDVLPEFAPPYVEVQTEALGLSAAEVENMITVPMEQDLLNGVAWLDEIRSESVTGLSRIMLIFEPGTDLMRARQVVQERLTMAHALPNVSKPPQMIQPLASTSRVMLIRLSSQELSQIDMSVLARWTIRPALMGVPGVANVAIWGQRERQLQVQVDPERLLAAGVTLDQVIETTGNALFLSPLTFLEASTPGSGGFIDTPNQRLGIQHLLPIRTPDDLAQVTLEGCTGGLPTATRHVDANCPTPPEPRAPLRIGDVATVVEDHQPLIGDAVSTGDPGLLLVIEKFPETNTLEVTANVDAALDSIRPGISGIQIDTTVYRPATFIETALDNLTAVFLIGALLALVLLAAFFFDWRAALVSASAIPLSLMAAALVLHLRGATFNLLILAGLVVALGAVIDDAIVGVDTVVRRLRQHRQAGSDKSTAAIVLEASLEARGAIVYATLIVLLAAVPIYYLPGQTGAFSRPLIVSYALATLASMAVALTVTPALCGFLFAKAPLDRRESPLVRWLQRGYDAALRRVIRTPRWTYATVAVALVVGLAGATQLEASSGKGMLPPLQDGDLLIHWDGAPGVSLPEMSRITEQVSGELRAVPGVRNVGAHIGRAITSDQVVDVNAGELWVSVDQGADYGQTVAAVQEVVDGYPGLYHDVLTHTEERLGELRTGVDDDLVVRVYGQELATLRAKAEEVRQILSEMDGVVDPRVDLQAEQPQVEVEVDLAKAQAAGVKPGDVRRASAALLSGIEVGNLFEEQKVFEVMVVGVPNTRHSLTSIRELMIETPAGGFVRLGDVADLRIAPNQNVIEHDAVSRYVDVTAGVDGSVAGELDERLAALEFPREYHAEVLGEYAERQAAQRRLLGVGIAAAVGVFLLLQAAFASWRLATVVFLTLPSALVGGVLTTWVAGNEVSLGTLVGFLAVLGIAGRNGIMLISHYQHLEREEGEPFGLGLVLRGARERLAPILMTALATGLALVPLVVAGSIPGLEVEYPLAVVILGGLVTSTLLNLFVLPGLYARLAPSALPTAQPVPWTLSPSASPASD